MVNIDHPVIKMFQFNVLLVRLLTSMQSSMIYDVLTVRGSFQPYENRLYTPAAEFTIAVLKSTLYGFQGSSSHGMSQ